ncbi:MAG TPA: hypothetical protein VMM59_03835 [Thermohalobaculum sp.]|nr:hypothetical protein [Thermohalobaculum sp.]
MSWRSLGASLLAVAVLFFSYPAYACHKDKGFLFIPNYYPTFVHEYYRTTVTTPAIYRDGRRAARLATIAEWERLARQKMAEIESRGVEFAPGDDDVFWNRAKHSNMTCKKINLKTTQSPTPGNFFCKASAMICQGGLPIMK